MKIGIDARMMGKGFGLARYIEQLVLHLEKIDKKNEYVLFIRDDSQQSFKIKNLKFKIVEANISWYSFEEQVKFPKIIKQEKVDLMHFPHWNVPIFYIAPYVVTIHDLTMFHFPRPEATTLGPVKFWIKDKAHRFVIKNAVKKAKHIITTSEFTKHDLHFTLGVPLDKMVTTYQAPFVNAIQDAGNTGKILEKYCVDKPFVIYVGAAYPHKNVEGLLKAWQIFEQKYGSEYKLLLVGKENYFWTKIKSKIENLPAGQAGLKSVMHIGFVPDKELSQFYRHAKLYVFPSLYEGFGLPPLEAMVHGVPIASSNSSCLPEVLGEAALYFDPKNHVQMAEVIYSGLTDENIRHDLKVKGRSELKKYSWDRLTEQTLEIYQKGFSSKF